MTTLADKLKMAGADTIGARFTTSCTDALKAHPTDMNQAWRMVGSLFGYQFLEALRKDMHGNCVSFPIPQAFSAAAADRVVRFEPPAHEASAPVKPYQPRIVAAERVAKRKELAKIIRSKFSNSNGVYWSDVSWHELSALSRDGKEAVALLAAAPSIIPNDGRTVGDVLGVKRIDEIIGALRK